MLFYDIYFQDFLKHYTAEERLKAQIMHEIIKDKIEKERVLSTPYYWQSTYEVKVF
jgi:hypothetical protein